MSGSGGLARDVDLDIKGLLGAVWRKKFLVLLLTLIGGAIIFAITSSISPRYKSDAQILVKKRESIFTRVDDPNLQTNGGEFDEQAVASQVLVLSSDDLAIEAILELGLDKKAEFTGEGESSGFMQLIGALLPSTGSGRPPRISEQDVDPMVLQRFKERLTVYAAERSRVIVVEFWSNDPELARLVPNTLARNYLEFTRNAKLESDEAATEWLGPEIEALRANVRAAEERVAEYRSSADLLLGNNNSLLATQQLSEVSSELSRVRAERTSAEAKIETIRSALASGASVDVIPDIIASPIIQRLRERKSGIDGEVSELSATLLPNHPRIRALRSQQTDIDRQMRQAASDILESLESNVDLSRKQESVLLQEVNRLKAESSRVGEAEVRLRALEREAAAERERLEGYLVRFNEVQSRQNRGYVPEDAKIIEHAVVPAESHFPKVVPFTIAGAVATMILSIVGILTSELLSGRAFRPVDEITPDRMPERINVAAAPPLVPADTDFLREPDEVPLPPSSVANDRDVYSFTHAMRAIAETGHGAIAVVSAGGHGSACAIDLARSLAASGHRTVIADLAGDGETALAMLGTADAPGVFDVIAGRASLREVLFQDSQSAVHVLAAGDPGDAPSAGMRLSRVAAALAQSYDFVVYDCGETGSAGLAHIADGQTVILVPVTPANASDARTLERELRTAGFDDTLLVSTDHPASQQVRAGAA